MKDYDIKVIEKQDHDDIVNFVRKYFMKDEPINQSINLVTDDKPVNLELEAFLLKDLHNGISLKAVQNGNLIGVCVNSIIEKNQPHDVVENTDNEDFKKIVNFLAYMDQHSDPFQKFPGVDRAVAATVLAVDPSCRGMGIAKKLMDTAWVMGKQNNCGFMLVECSSFYTAKAVEKLGFELIFQLDYKDYKVDGEVVFKTEPPHTASRVYVKSIQ